MLAEIIIFVLDIISDQ